MPSQVLTLVSAACAHDASMGSTGTLGGVETTLQGVNGVHSYWQPIEEDFFTALSPVFTAGLTPIMSYWSSDDMSWFDQNTCSCAPLPLVATLLPPTACMCAPCSFTLHVRTSRTGGVLAACMRSK